MSKAHCDGGAWVSGDWVSIEECGDAFVGAKTKPHSGDATGKGKCAVCPRSRTRHCAAKGDGSYDVAVIGAGCVGSAVARELSKTSARVVLLEAADDVTQGATKGNSGIVHAGFDDTPGSVRAKYCNAGCLMFPQLDAELHFGYQRNGSLVVARGAADEKVLEQLLAKGAKNGVAKLRIIGQEELRRREPYITPDATAALLAEDAGTVVPYEFSIALAESAADNGVEVRVRREVVGIDTKAPDGLLTITAKYWEDPKVAARFNRAQRGRKVQPQAIAGAILAAAVTFAAAGPVAAAAALVISFVTLQISLFALGIGSVSAGEPFAETTSYEPSKGTKQGGPFKLETIRAAHVVNCAGTKADMVAQLVGDASFQINERHGDYVVLHKREGKRATSTLFPCPGPFGKGVLVQATLWGNLILGPTARDALRKDEATGKLVVNEETRDESNESILRKILGKCAELVPSFDAREVVTTFSGARPKSTRGDWIVEPCSTEGRMIHAAGIDSPGLAGSPAIAVDVVRLLKAAGANVTAPNVKFNPLRRPIAVPKQGLKDLYGTKLVMGAVGKAKTAESNVVCKCEKVTEAEIVDALHRSLPIDSTQAVRKRTRAGMGHCQGEPGNYDCETRVAAIIARELGVPLADVGQRPWPASGLMPKRWFDDKDRDWVKAHQVTA
jgi:L-2-hydroxyglutarate oxidase LhgO